MCCCVSGVPFFSRRSGRGVPPRTRAAPRGGGRGRQQCAVSTLLLLRSHGRKKEEYLVYMDMVVPDGSLSTVSRRRQPGERNCTRNFVLCFCLIFFRASKWGDRASSRGLVLRLGLRHRRSDPIVITDRSSSLCVHGPPGASGGPKLVCGASPPRRRIVGAAATRLPRTIHRCGGGRRASTETAAELVLWSRGGHRL